MESQCQQQELAALPIRVVFDSFMGWAQKSAEKLLISCVEFNPCGPFGVSGLISVLHSIMQRALQKEGDDCVVLSLDLPKPLRFQSHEINRPFWSVGEMNRAMNLFVKMSEIVDKSGLELILNTFEELESKYLRHLRNLTGKPVWALGPFLSMGDE
ncbi:hypothetical protein SUGI_0075430 [Cryptomeria japonica]|nr:hypothetical protein SUGI_0075430 [Cryptomeria japonica]